MKKSNLSLLKTLSIGALLVAGVVSCGEQPTTSTKNPSNEITSSDKESSSVSNSSSANNNSSTSSAEPEEDYVPVNPVFRFEAEQANITTSVNKGILPDLTYFVFDVKLGGSLATKSLSNVGSDTKFTFKITSDKAVSNAKMALKMNVDDKFTTKTTLDQCLDVKNNGTAVDLSGVELKNNPNIVPQGVAIGKESLGQFFRFQTFRFNFNLVEGENEIVVSYKGAKFGGNFDFMEIETDAKLTGFTPAQIGTEGSKWEVIKEPTAEEKGIIKVTSPEARGEVKYNLPVLSENSGYKVEGDNYSFTIKGETHTFTKA